MTRTALAIALLSVLGLAGLAGGTLAGEGDGSVVCCGPPTADPSPPPSGDGK